MNNAVTNAYDLKKKPKSHKNKQEKNKFTLAINVLII
jgi:hypothetical protein